MSNSKNKRKKFIPKNKPPSQPIFIRYFFFCIIKIDQIIHRVYFYTNKINDFYAFRCFIFSPEVPVKLDYHGKRVDMSHGSLAGILMGLGQLNNSELRLRKISHRHGLLGFDKLLNFVLLEWANDIKKNQLPSLLGGVGPMHSLVQLSTFVLPLIYIYPFR